VQNSQPVNTMPALLMQYTLERERISIVLVTPTYTTTAQRVRAHGAPPPDFVPLCPWPRGRRAWGAVMQ